MAWVRAAAAVGLAIGLAMGLASCSLPAPDAKAETLAKAVFDQVRRGDDDAVAQEMLPAARSADLKSQLAQVRGFIPQGEPRSVTQRSWSVNTMIGQGDTATYIYAYDYGDRMVTSQVTLFRPNAGSPWLVQGFHVNTESAAPPAQTPPAPPPPAVGGSGDPAGLEPQNPKTKL